MEENMMEVMETEEVIPNEECTDLEVTEDVENSESNFNTGEAVKAGPAIVGALALAKGTVNFCRKHHVGTKIKNGFNRVFRRKKKCKIVEYTEVPETEVESDESEP